jgi:hypothetical protein
VSLTWRRGRAAQLAALDDRVLPPAARALRGLLRATSQAGALSPSVLRRARGLPRGRSLLAGVGRAGPWPRAVLAAAAAVLVIDVVIALLGGAGR